MHYYTACVWLSVRLTRTAAAQDALSSGVRPGRALMLLVLSRSDLCGWHSRYVAAAAAQYRLYEPVAGERLLFGTSDDRGIRLIAGGNL